jgi:hypothetical protein
MNSARPTAAAPYDEEFSPQYLAKIRAEDDAANAGRANAKPVEDSHQEAAPPAPAPADTERIAAEAKRLLVENFTGFSDLREFVYQRLPAEQRAFLLKGEYAVFAQASAFDPIPNTGNNYCYAMVGLSRPQPEDRNPRLPANRMVGFLKYAKIGPLNDDQQRDCKVQALEAAIERFAANTVAGLLDKSEAVEDAGKRASRPPGPTSINMFFQPGSEVDEQAVGELVPDSFRRSFDFRKLAWVASSSHTTFDHFLVCFSSVGVAVMPPDARNARSPGYRIVSVREVDLANESPQGAASRCETEVLRQGVQGLLQLPWNETGLLKDLKLTRETGVPLVHGVNHQ